MTPLVIRSFVVAAAALITAIGVSRSVVDAQSQQRVSVYGTRPLSDALLELEKLHRWVVTYEDPYYEYQGEMVDFRPQIGPSSGPRARPMLFPPRRAFVFDYPTTDVATPDILVANLVSRYHNQYGDYEYRLVREGMWLHVLPSASNNTKGVWTPRASRLDVRVTLPNAERTVEVAIRSLVDAVNQATAGSNITLGVGGERLFDRVKVRTRDNEIARHVLMRVLESTGRRFRWHLLCTFDETPGKRTDFNDGLCGLNFTDLDL